MSNPNPLHKLRLGMYQNVREVGKGEFSTVTLVKSGNTQYALKAFKTDSQITTGEKAQVIHRDLQVAEHLSHPNLVILKEAFIENDLLYLVMDYYEINLARHLETVKMQGSSLSKVQIIAYSAQLTDAVVYLHENKLIHRNITTRNIFVTSQETIKLADYGLASISDLYFQQGLSKEIANMAYLAPEILRNENYDEKVDIWAIGCVLVELCTLHPAFVKSNIEATRRSIMEDVVPRLPASYSSELQPLADAMLRKTASARPSAQTILEETVLQKHVSTTGKKSGANQGNQQKVYPVADIGDDQSVQVLLSQLDALKRQSQADRQLIGQLRQELASARGEESPDNYGRPAGVVRRNVPSTGQTKRQPSGSGVATGDGTAKRRKRDKVGAWISEKKEHPLLKKLALLPLACLILFPLGIALALGGSAYLLSHLFDHSWLPHILPDIHLPDLHIPHPHLPDIHMPDIHLPDIHIPGISKDKPPPSMTERVGHASAEAAKSVGHAGVHAAKSVGNVGTHAVKVIAKTMLLPIVLWTSIPLLGTLLLCGFLLYLWRHSHFELSELRRKLGLGNGTDQDYSEDEVVDPDTIPANKLQSATKTDTTNRVVPTGRTTDTTKSTTVTTTPVKTEDTRQSVTKTTDIYTNTALKPAAASHGGEYSKVDWATLNGGDIRYKDVWQNMILRKSDRTILHLPPLILDKSLAHNRSDILLVTYFKRVDEKTLTLYAAFRRENIKDTTQLQVDHLLLKVKIQLSYVNADQSVLRVVEEESTVKLLKEGEYKSIMTVPFVESALPPTCKITILAA